MSADRNLLFGILALQNGFIGRTQLIDAMTAWAVAKQRALGEILVERDAMRPEHRRLLDALLDAHVARHGGERASLASLSSASSAADALRAIDPDIDASLAEATTPEPSSGEPATAAPVKRAGSPRFRILRAHARGGLGEVFVAHDEELNRQVALKEIQESHADQPESQGRFLLEAEITGGLEHPGVVPVYGLGRYDDGRPFYAMRFIKGDSLRDAIARFHDPEARLTASERQLALRDLLGRFVDVCNAVAYAHSRGVLHRDLKPGNVMLGKYGETLVVDWGLAKAAGATGGPDEAALRPSVSGDGTLTQTGKVLGTPAYMSPEQADGRLDLTGPRSDVYSLGATLYCILTGEAPFPRGELPDVLARVRKGDFQRPSEVKPGVPPALEAVCLRAMALKPEGRYADAEALAAEVEHWLADEPVRAYREPAAARAARWMRKHPAAVAVLAAALLLAAPLAGMLAWVSDGARRRAEADTLRIRQEQERTERERAKAVRLAERSRKIRAFYERHILAAPRPLGGGQAFDVKLKQVLDEAGPRIGAAFADEPEDELAVCDALGETYHLLGENVAAEAIMRRAVELARGLHGERSKEYLEAQAALAVTRLFLGRDEEGTRMLEAAIKEASAVLGPTHRTTLTARHNRALGLQHLGRLDLAEAECRGVIAARTEALGPNADDTLDSSALLALILTDRGRHAEAERAYRGLLPLVRRTRGHDHPHTLTLEHNLADVLARDGRNEQASRLLAAVVASRKRVCGPEHQHTLASQARLAGCLNEMNRPGEAEALFREILPALTRTLGPEAFLTLTARHNRALGLLHMGRLAEAEAELRDLMAIRTRALGPHSPDTLSSTALLASVQVEQGRHAEAEETLRALLPMVRRTQGPDHPLTLTVEHNIADAMARRGQGGRAARLLEAVIASRLRVRGPEHLDTLASQGLLASCLNDLNRPKEAEALLRKILPILARTLGPGAYFTLTARHNLALSLLAQSRLAEAEKEAREVIAVRMRLLGGAHPDTLATQNLLAVVSIARNDPTLFDEVEAMLTRSIPAAERTLGPTHPLTANLTANAVGVYLSRSKHAESLPLLWKLTSRGLMSDTIPSVLRTMRLSQQTFLLSDPRRDWETRLLAAWAQMEGRRHSEAEKEFRAFLAAKAFTEADWQHHAAGSLLGDCLTRQKKFADAEPLLLASQEGLVRSKGCPPDRVAEGRARLARLYDAWGKPEKAAAWKSP